ncbi:unnamed protein product [Vitrella brassicaformis CCMP3155]|uniref:Uncharacterized protein n=2 Tax=Vitrella brassicaformis TaxID=1169539 RepID=A0A0G4GI39_VITBC|nr:unnamed protein product [Vitrella brassicaformis CCMP3155]|eukprot:CEM29434.1 unnamed protein product [Vitrella brassicaformis CCMP3155]
MEGSPSADARAAPAVPAKSHARNHEISTNKTEVLYGMDSESGHRLSRLQVVWYGVWIVLPMAALSTVFVWLPTHDFWWLVCVKLPLLGIVFGLTTLVTLRYVPPERRASYLLWIIGVVLPAVVLPVVVPFTARTDGMKLLGMCILLFLLGNVLGALQGLIPLPPVPVGQIAPRSLCVTVPYMQLAYSLMFAWTFGMVQGIRFAIPSLCVVYPVGIGMIKALEGKLEARVQGDTDKLGTIMSFQSIIFASVPYRFVFFMVESWLEIILILLVKVVYKLIVFPLLILSLQQVMDKVLESKLAQKAVPLGVQEVLRRASRSTGVTSDEGHRDSHEDAATSERRTTTSSDGGEADGEVAIDVNSGTASVSEAQNGGQDSVSRDEASKAAAETKKPGFFARVFAWLWQRMSLKLEESMGLPLKCVAMKFVLQQSNDMLAIIAIAAIGIGLRFQPNNFVYEMPADYFNRIVVAAAIELFLEILLSIGIPWWIRRQTKSRGDTEDKFNPGEVVLAEWSKEFCTAISLSLATVTAFLFLQLVELDVEPAPTE